MTIHGMSIVGCTGEFYSGAVNAFLCIKLLLKVRTVEVSNKQFPELRALQLDTCHSMFLKLAIAGFRMPLGE